MDPPPFTVEPEDLPTYSEALLSSRSNSLAHNPPLVPRTPTTHCYELRDKPRHAWLRMKCTSRSRVPEQLPRIIEGDKIVGEVEMDLLNPTSVKLVKITVIGELVARADETFPFLELSQDLWVDDASSSLTTSPSSLGNIVHKGKLRGSFSWPFSFELPRTVTVLDHTGNPAEFRLPGTYIPRHAKCTVIYRLSAIVVHGKFTPDHHLSTTIAYVPMITPEPPSLARQLAYEDHFPLLGLNGDPEGWESLPSISIPGMTYGDAVDVGVTLSLAKPLCYTRGSVIPLILTIRCTDAQALEALSAPEAFTVRLRRTLFFGYGKVGKEEPSILSKGQHLAMCRNREHLVCANWWRTPHDNITHDTTTQMLQGEIQLPLALAPGGQLGPYKLTYDVALYSPDVAAFALTFPKRDLEPLQAVPVEIATAHAPGPRPVVYSPPNYIADEEARRSREASRFSSRQGFL